jgi:prevent-host-death family protein
MKQQMGAGEFKAKCLSVLDEVQRTRKEVVITKRGKPVARLLPPAEEDGKPLFGRMKGTIKILGDIVSPIDVEWGGDEENLR